MRLLACFKARRFSFRNGCCVPRFIGSMTRSEEEVSGGADRKIPIHIARIRRHEFLAELKIK
jgi:hypothetical protein